MKHSFGSAVSIVSGLVCALGINSAVAPGTAHAFVDPVTVYAAASQAKEIAEKGKAILEFIGYMPSKPDPLAGLPNKLNEIQESLDRIEAQTTETLDIIRRIEDHAVASENEAAFTEFLDTLNFVTEARISLAYLVENPNDPGLTRDADVASRLAIQNFENRTRIFRAVGPLISDVRFQHVFAYPTYLNAIALRAAFVQIAHGSRGFSRQPYRSEFAATAKKLRTFVAVINDPVSLEVRVRMAGDLNPIECTGAALTLVDHIGSDRVEAEKPEFKKTVIIEFPGTTCSLAAVNFYLEDPTNQLRWERAAFYGSEILTFTAERLENYVAYGQANRPNYRFPDWIAGSLYAKADGFVYGSPVRTLVPAGAAEPGVALQLARADSALHWQIPIGRGYIKLLSQDVCITSANGVAITLEVCSGASDQSWTRTMNGPVRHDASGRCLSVLSTRRLPGGMLSMIPGLHLRACDGGADQIWYTTDPDAPGPVIR